MFLNGRIWHGRTLILAKDVVYITRNRVDNAAVDIIPLSEVLEIKTMSHSRVSSAFVGDGASRDGDRQRISVELAGKGLRDSILQLRTVPDGFNSGRVYYFEVGSGQRCHVVVAELAELAAAARRRADRATRWSRCAVPGI